jgi:hypothetical protein
MANGAVSAGSASSIICSVWGALFARSADRLACFLRLSRRKSSEHLDHFFIRNLLKIGVIEADSPKNSWSSRQASLLKLFEHLVSGGLTFGFNAPNMAIDLVISGCKPFELVIRFR